MGSVLSSVCLGMSWHFSHSHVMAFQPLCVSCQVFMYMHFVYGKNSSFGVTKLLLSGHKSIHSLQHNRRCRHFLCPDNCYSRCEGRNVQVALVEYEIKENWRFNRFKFQLNFFPGEGSWIPSFFLYALTRYNLPIPMCTLSLSLHFSLKLSLHLWFLFALLLVFIFIIGLSYLHLLSVHDYMLILKCSKCFCCCFPFVCFYFFLS